MANMYRSVLAGGGGVQPTGDAVAADVLSGKTFSNADGIGKTGTMPNNGAVSGTATPSQPYTIPAGYHNGSGTVTAAGSDIVDSSHALVLATNGASNVANFTSGTAVAITTTRGGIMMINVENISSISSIRGSLENAAMNTEIRGITSAGAVSASSLGFADTAGTSNINVSSYKYIAIVFGSTGGTAAVSFTVTI